MHTIKFEDCPVPTALEGAFAHMEGYAEVTVSSGVVQVEELTLFKYDAEQEGDYASVNPKTPLFGQIEKWFLANYTDQAIAAHDEWEADAPARQGDYEYDCGAW